MAPLRVHHYSVALPTTTIDTVSEFHAEAPQVTASEGLAQGPNVAAGARFEPTTLRTKGVESTAEPPRFTIIYFLIFIFCAFSFGIILLFIEENETQNSNGVYNFYSSVNLIFVLC